MPTNGATLAYSFLLKRFERSYKGLLNELGEVIKKLGFKLRLVLGLVEFLLFWNVFCVCCLGLRVENWAAVIAVLLEFSVEFSDAMILKLLCVVDC